ETHAPFGRIALQRAEHGVPHQLVRGVGDIDLVQARPAHQAATAAATEPCTGRGSRRVAHPLALSALPAPFADPRHVRDHGPDGLDRGVDDDRRLTLTSHPLDLRAPWIVLTSLEIKAS